MARELLLALSYGVDEIEVYSLFDQQNLYHTIMPEEYENNFGLFYQQDYSGRIFQSRLQQLMQILQGS